MRKFRLHGNFTGPRYNQKAVDDWAKRQPLHDDPLESTYSALLLTVIVVASIFFGVIIALVVFGEN